MMNDRISVALAENADALFESDTDNDIINQILKGNNSESEDSNLDYINDISNFPSELETVNPSVTLDSTDQDEIDRLRYIDNLSNFGNVEENANDVTKKFIELALILGKKKSIATTVDYGSVLKTFFQEETGPDSLYTACYEMNKICSTLMKNPAVAHYDLFADSLICNKPVKKMPAPSSKKLTQPLAKKMPPHTFINYNNNEGLWSTDRQCLGKRPLSNRKQRPLRFVKKNFNAEPL